MNSWNYASLPKDLSHGQTNRIFIVTGGNTGLGKETVRALAERKAEVILACRDVQKGEAARGEILSSTPDAKIRVEALDLADLASVHAFAKRAQDLASLDVLINNAGCMAVPLSKTKDGFEMQMGVNHLGHFALTALLFPKLKETEGSRVVNVTSIYHRGGQIDFQDPFFESKKYSKWQAYRNSKIANLFFTYELDRRLRIHARTQKALAAHPGYSNTELQARGPQLEGSGFMEGLMKVSNSLFAQPAAMGALPQLRAALDPQAQSGEYFGPGGLFETRGPAIKVDSNPDSKNREVAQSFWAWSEEMTKISFSV